MGRCRPRGAEGAKVPSKDDVVATAKREETEDVEVTRVDEPRDDSRADPRDDPRGEVAETEVWPPWGAGFGRRRRMRFRGGGAGGGRGGAGRGYGWGRFQ